MRHCRQSSKRDTLELAETLYLHGECLNQCRKESRGINIKTVPLSPQDACVDSFRTESSGITADKAGGPNLASGN